MKDEGIDMQNILVIMENNSFIVRNIMEQLQGLNYSVETTELDIQEISLHKNNYEAIFLYTESDTDVNAKELIFIRDKAVEESIPMFFLGEDAENLQSIFPEYVLKSVFSRPVDVKATAKIIDKYIKEYGKQIRKKIFTCDKPIPTKLQR